MQVVDNPTRFEHDGAASLIDLVLMSNQLTLHQCGTIPPLADPDHLGISLCIKGITHTPSICSKRRVIWRYEHADFHRACEQLDDLDLDSIFSDPSIDVCWDRWKTSFLSVMDTCIPKSTP